MFRPGWSEARNRRRRAAMFENGRGTRTDPHRVSPVEPTFAQRYECKYLVSPMLVPEIRRFLQPFAEPDAFAIKRSGLRYPICSLYLDSEDLSLYRQTVCGEKDRFKLRVRTYTDDPGDPAFFEVKRKTNSVVHKRRAGLTRAQAERALAEEIDVVSGEFQGRRRADLEYFAHHARRISARPVVRVRYWREAYQATGNEPVRVTIDTDLSYSVTLNDRLSHSQGSWTSIPLEGTIVEIKFTERFPWWVEELVRRFGMRQRSVPKYILCVDRALRSKRGIVANLGGNLPSWGT